jgi:signal peptidase I
VADSRPRRIWQEWRGFFLFVAVMLVFRSAVADWNHVPSGSMLPSILVGDRIVVDKLAYDLRLPFTLMRLASWRLPHRGDVVTFTSPEDGQLLVKRVVAVPGDEVSLHHNRLTVNGESATYQQVSQEQVLFPVLPGYGLYRESILGSERFVMLHNSRSASLASSFGPTRVPQGEYLMLGDNRDNSRDSRVIGFVPQHNILGRARAVAFSLDYENYYAPRLQRFLTGLP